MAKRKKPSFQGGARYRHPQAWIDHVLATDPALANVRLTCRPRYSGQLGPFGHAVLWRPNGPSYTTIGKRSLVSRLELLDTIIHEELHHRLWQRAQSRCRRALSIMADLDREEDYVKAVAARFLIAKGRLP